MKLWWKKKQKAEEPLEAKPETDKNSDGILFEKSSRRIFLQRVPVMGAAASRTDIHTPPAEINSAKVFANTLRNILFQVHGRDGREAYDYQSMQLLDEEPENFASVGEVTNHFYQSYGDYRAYLKRIFKEAADLDQDFAKLSKKSQLKFLGSPEVKDVMNDYVRMRRNGIGRAESKEMFDTFWGQIQDNTNDVSVADEVADNLAKLHDMFLEDGTLNLLPENVETVEALVEQDFSQIFEENLRGYIREKGIANPALRLKEDAEYWKENDDEHGDKKRPWELEKPPEKPIVGPPLSALMYSVMPREAPLPGYIVHWPKPKNGMHTSKTAQHREAKGKLILALVEEYGEEISIHAYPHLPGFVVVEPRTSKADHLLAQLAVEKAPKIDAYGRI